MSTTPNPLAAEVKALAAHCVETGDQVLAEDFAKSFGMAPDAFVALDETQQHAQIAKQGKNSNPELKWVGNAYKAIAIDPAGLKVAVRLGNEVVTFGDVENRLNNGEKGDDLPIVMSEFGVDYDAACNAVFGNQFKEAIGLLRQAQRYEQRHLVVDGLDETCNFAGDGQRAPFVVFDADNQANIAGPFSTRELAEQHRLEILAGKPPQLDGNALQQALDDDLERGQDEQMAQWEAEHNAAMEGEPSVVWQEDSWISSDDGFSESKNCVVRYPSGTFVYSEMVSERGGEPRFESIGEGHQSLQDALAAAKVSHQRMALKDNVVRPMEVPGKLQESATPSVSELTRAYNERLHTALSQAAPIIAKAWTAAWKKKAVVDAVAAPITDSRDQAVSNTFLIQDCWANVYEPTGNYKSPERKALADEFSALLRGDILEKIPKVSPPSVEQDDSPSLGM